MKRVLAGLALAGALAGLTGCASTGGGTIPTNAGDRSGKANFGYTYDSSKDKYQGTYKDGYVSMSFTGVDYQSVPCNYGYESYVPSTVLTYRSTNPKMPGSGTVQVQFCDYGEGTNGTGDYLSVNVLSGPFEGYSDAGTVQGNIQQKKK